MDWWREKKNKKKRNLERGAMLLEDLIKCFDGKSNPIKIFSARQIRKASNNFSFSNNYVFGLSSFYCAWYTGKNENHPMILIRSFNGVFLKIMGLEQGSFCRDIAISSMVSGHKNFLKLVGCCLESKLPLMVYDGVKKHDKLEHIIRELQWKKRMKVAEDIATALAYLHTAFPSPFVYRSLISDEVLLDEDGVAKLSDFSYCVSIPKGETFVKVYNSYYGDIYMDSKYMRDGLVSMETDVYAIGMLMQKLLNGFCEVRVDQLFNRITQNERSDDSIIETEAKKIYIQNWLFKLMEDGRMEETVDPEMLKKMGEISEEELCQMKAFLMLSHRCINDVEVPTMVEVAKELKKIRIYTKNNSSSPSGETKFNSSSSQTRL